jgi:hypothetical protein
VGGEVGVNVGGRVGRCGTLVSVAVGGSAVACGTGVTLGRTASVGSSAVPEEHAPNMITTIVHNTRFNTSPYCAVCLTDMTLGFV